MRVYMFLVAIVGLQILFFMAGINDSTGFVLSQLGVNHPENLTSTPFYQEILLILAAIVASSVIIGLFAGYKIESVLLASFVTMLLKFLGDMVFVMTYAKARYCPTAVDSSCWVSNIVLLIMFPLAIGFLFSIVSWWLGRD